MANDKKVSDLTAVTSLDGDELVHVVDDPSGTPADKKITVANLFASPALTGNPTAPTQTAGNSSTRLATTAFVGTAVSNQAATDAGTYDPLARRDGPKVLPPPNSTIISTFQSGHGYTNFSSTLASLTDDTADFALGSQSIRAITKTDNTAGSFQKSGQSIDLTGKSLAVLVKIDDVTNLTELMVYAGDTALGNYYQWTVEDNGGSAQQYIKSGEWVWVILSIADAAVIGTPPRSAIQTIRLRQRASNGNSLTVRWNAVGTVTEQGVFPHGVVSICWDDGFITQKTYGRPKLDQYLFPATAYVIADLIGSSGSYMTLDDLKAAELQSGWAIGGHAYASVDHAAGLSTLSDADLETDLKNLRNWLLANGFRGADHLAWPLGAFDPEAIAVAKRYFGSARSIVSRTKHEHIRPSQAFRLRSLSITESNQATVAAAIDAAYTNKSWLILTFHNIVTSSPGSNDILQTNFNTIIDYIATKGIAVRNVGDVLASGVNGLDAAETAAAATTTEATARAAADTSEATTRASADTALDAAMFHRDTTAETITGPAAKAYTAGTVDPSGPSTGLARLYPRTVAGRERWYQLAATGSAMPLAVEPWAKSWCALVPQSSTSIRTLGHGAATSPTGTVSHPGTTADGYLANLASAASAAATASAPMSGGISRRGATSDLLGGFFFHCRAMFPDASYDNTGASTGSRLWAGVMASFGSVLATDRGSTFNLAAFVRAHVNGGATDTNWQFVTNNGGTGTSTVADTGLAFTIGHVYDFAIWCPLGGTTIYWRIHDRTAGTSAVEGSATQTLPGATTLMNGGVGLQTVDAVARNARFRHVYVESDVG